MDDRDATGRRASDTPMVPMQDLLELKLAAMSEGIRAELRGLRAEVAEMRVANSHDHGEVKAELRDLGDRVSALEKQDLVEHVQEDVLRASRRRTYVVFTVLLTAASVFSPIFSKLVL